MITPINYPFYKTQINLADYLTRIKGWKIIEKGRSPKLQHPSLDEKWIVSKSKIGYFSCWNQENPLGGPDSGKSIFDVIAREYELNGKSIHHRAIAQSLDLYIASGEYIEPNSCDLYIGDKLSADQVQSIIGTLKPLNILKSYLEERGINNAILTDYRIDGTILEKINRIKDSNEFERSIAFKLHDKTGKVTGISLKSSSQKGKCLGSKHESLVSSNSNSFNKNEPLTIYINESYLDALSYFQLNYDRLKDANFVLTSTEGTPQKEQIAIIQQAIDNSAIKIEKIVIAFDNDLKGQEFNAAVIYNLRFPESNKIFDNTELQISKESIDITFPISERNEKLSEKLDELKSLFKNIDFQSTTNMDKNEITFKIIAPQTINEWKQFNSDFNTLIHGESSRLQVISANSKDFNMDLTNIKKESKSLNLNNNTNSLVL